MHTREDQRYLGRLSVPAYENREWFAEDQLVESASVRVIEVVEQRHTAAEP